MFIPSWIIFVAFTLALCAMCEAGASPNQEDTSARLLGPFMHRWEVFRVEKAVQSFTFRVAPKGLDYTLSIS